MEPRAHHVLIGLFTVLTLGAALLFALWLNKAGAERAFTDYEVIFNETVSGLSQGSAVQSRAMRLSSTWGRPHSTTCCSAVAACTRAVPPGCHSCVISRLPRV